MTVVEVKIGSLSLQLESSDPQKLLQLAEEVNSKVSAIKVNYSDKLTDIKALLISAILLQDEVHKAEIVATQKANTAASEHNDELKNSFYALLESLTYKINELALFLHEKNSE